ncbi:MAG: hypothetical protein ABIH11_05730 [Candidatus Altiarchaeota archaeon]
MPGDADEDLRNLRKKFFPNLPDKDGGEPRETASKDVQEPDEGPAKSPASGTPPEDRSLKPTRVIGEERANEPTTPPRPEAPVNGIRQPTSPYPEGISSIAQELGIPERRPVRTQPPMPPSTEASVNPEYDAPQREQVRPAPQEQPAKQPYSPIPQETQPPSHPIPQETQPPSPPAYSPVPSKEPPTQTPSKPAPTAKQDSPPDQKVEDEIERLRRKYNLGSSEPGDSGKEKPTGALTWSAPEEPKAEKSMEEAKSGGRKIPVKIILILVVLAAVVGAAYYVLVMSPPEEKLYQCPTGEFMANLSACPPIETTTTTETTTLPPTTLPPFIFTTSTTTTLLVINCTINDDCSNKEAERLFCEDRFVKTSYVTYLCMKPGTPESYCVAKAKTPRLVKKCGDKEYCLDGECYSEKCRNNMLDEGEEKVDCGGVCRECGPEDTACNNNKECGEDDCGNYHCKDGDVYMHCTRNICINPGKPNAECKTEEKVELNDKCGFAEVCIEGQDDCISGHGAKANCHDCIRNQGEEGIDCGGPCPKCAIRPQMAVDTMNLTSLDTFEYELYKLKLLRVTVEETCANEAKIMIVSPDGPWRNTQVSYHENTEVYGLQVGLVRAEPSYAIVWLYKP